MSLYTDQIASVLRRAVQTVIERGLNDPRMRGLTSVTEVKVAPDLSQAVVSVSVMPAEQAELNLHALRHAAGHIRSVVGRRVQMRRIPRLIFRLDHSIKKEAATLAAIERARSGGTETISPDESPAGAEESDE
jgi:ribosome-binding factor A